MKNSHFKILDGHVALGTAWWVEAFHDCDIETLHTTVRRFLQEFEAAYSRFLADSVVSRLNTARRLEGASEEFLQLLKKGLELERTTDGVFSIGVGAYLENTGYNSTLDMKHGEGAVAVSGLDLVHIDGESIELEGEGNIDFGGLGKGFAIDAIAGILKEHDVEQFFINGGGDMFASAPVDIVLQHPTEHGQHIGSLSLEGAFAASSPFKRMWKDGENTYSHLVKVSGQTSSPLEGLTASYVLADTAVDADAFATVCSILGFVDIEKTQTLAKSQNFSYLVVDAHGKFEYSDTFPMEKIERIPPEHT